MTRTTTNMATLGLGALLSACPGTLDEASFYGSNAPSVSAAREGGADDEETSESPEPEPESWLRDAMAPLDAAPGDAAANDAGTRWADIDGAADAWPARPASDAAWEASLAEAAVGAEAAAPERDANGATPEAGPACDVRALFAQKCGNAGCHGAGAVASGLDLVSSDLATRLAGKKGSGGCGSYLLIDRDAPERSALYVKVTAEACGSRMPLGGTLSDREQTCILSWLESL
jgi:hypothetical protein